jgi:hypothetical protein
LLRGNKLYDDTTQENAGVNGDKWHRKVLARRGGVGSVLHFLLKYLLIILKLNFQKLTA